MVGWEPKCAMDAQEPCDGSTRFINILITDGQTNSTYAQYSSPLTPMYNAGITTFVVAYGEAVDTPSAINVLKDMASLGSGGTFLYHDTNDPTQLRAALVDILEAAALDPC